MALRTASQSLPTLRSGIFCCSMMSASCCRTSLALRSTAPHCRAQNPNSTLPALDH